MHWFKRMNNFIMISTNDAVFHRNAHVFLGNDEITKNFSVSSSLVLLGEKGMKSVTYKTESTIYLSPNEQSANITCNINSKPPPSTVTWILDESTNLTLGGGQVVDNCWTVIMEKPNGVTEIQLNINHVNNSTFKKYKLITENSIGQSSITGLQNPYTPHALPSLLTTPSQVPTNQTFISEKQAN
ncbi:hypothetical protein HELRODRAFT_161170 [Helobdella robusta]|uniref:Ig-like domain-containing protein n=1 Tax=Helobdella robusta TaxID=6412 RepID=T1ER64_HELRO|nr:hypothetical protein HELRODRAFT_161170 [Helobdella robusta]ESO01960.1 hypothetical protein HELRODRAFT_161170 [Helobdella robusta]